MMRWKALALILMLTARTQSQEIQRQFSTFTVAWWNVENLFDTRDDPRTQDDEFTPQGAMHWTQRKMWSKMEDMAKTLAMMDLPDVVGLAEVENKYVLRSLCEGTALGRAGYRYVHYDSPDRRGIDVALLYRADRFSVTSSRTVALSDSVEGFFTRDILVVEGVAASGDTVCLLLNHWPSKRGGDVSEEHRIEAARTLRSLMNDLYDAHPQAAVIAMGDMNSTADEAPISVGMGFGSDSINPEGIKLLVQRLPKDWGSHKYQGQWNYIDQMFLLADERWQVQKMKLVRYDHLLVEESKRPGVRPKRTNVGPHFEGGISDHLPLYLSLKHRDEVNE